MRKTYYQPIDRNGNLPEELHSFMAFDTREHCAAWMEDNLYTEDEYPIHEFHDDDIEDVTLIDDDGNFLDGTGSVGCYNTEKWLDEGYEMLMDTIRRAMDKSGQSQLPLNGYSCALYEDYNTLSVYDPGVDGHDRPTIVSVDLCNAYDGETVIDLANITDYDDFVMLNDAVGQEYDV